MSYDAFLLNFNSLSEYGRLDRLVVIFLVSLPAGDRGSEGVFITLPNRKEVAPEVYNCFCLR